MDDGVWKLLAEKMQKEFEDYNQFQQLLWADVRHLSSGVYIPSGYFDPSASIHTEGSQQFSLDDLGDLIDGLELRRNEPQFGSMVLSRKEMTRLEDAIRDARSVPPVHQTLFGFPVIVSDAVPEGEVWMVNRPLMEFGLRTWPAAIDDVITVTTDFEPPNLQPWQLYIILLVVMLVIMFIVVG